jgi:hypothetical protein
MIAKRVCWGKELFPPDLVRRQLFFPLVLPHSEMLPNLPNKLCEK